MYRKEMVGARRSLLGALAAGVGAAVWLGAGILGVASAQTAAPKSPVTINVVDVAGNLALTQEAIEAYRAKNPNLIAKINFTKAPSPECRAS